jgi:hypothetical protein
VNRHYLTAVLVILGTVLIVGEGFFRSVRALDKLNSNSLRSVTGAEGLSLNAKPSVVFPATVYTSDRQRTAWGAPTNLEGRTSSTESNRTKIALTGNATGIRTSHLLGNSHRSQSGLTRVNSAGPFSLDLTLVPALYNGQPGGSGISLRMPELSGSVGGDFMINSRERRFSAGRISIGNLHTPVKMNLHSGP